MHTYNGKKFLFLAFVLSAPFSFGEEFLSATLGESLFWEQFLAENYARNGQTIDSALTLYHYPENKSLGFFVHASYGKNAGTTYEKNKWERMRTRDYKSYDVRLSAGPSVKWNFTPSFFIPLSLGPVFSFYFEDTEEHLLKKDIRVSTTYLYTAVSGGIRGDLALVLLPSPDFFLAFGLTGNWLFFRAESLQMRMNYRTTNNAVLALTRYTGLDISFYLGIGIRFDLSWGQKTAAGSGSNQPRQADPSGGNGD
jgi:hypothetical protein